MKFKKTCSLLLISTMVLSSSALTFANTNNSNNTAEYNVTSNNNTQNIIISSDDEINEPSISPRSSQRVLLTDLTATDGSQSEYFSVEMSMTHYKVWVDNQSNVDYTVTVTSGSPSGALQYSFTVSAGKQKEVKAQIFVGGSRYVNITSKSGAPLKGQVGVRVTNTEGEL